MPKIKSNRAARKRFHVTAGGKIMRNQAFKSHILTKMTRKRKRNLGKSIEIDKANLKRVKRMLVV